MKKLALSLLASLAFFNGCVLLSVAPFYRTEDTLFDSGLVGDWVQIDDTDQHWKFEKAGARSYKLSHSEKTGAPVVSEVHLFKLGGSLFLDIAQNPDAPADDAFPPRIPSHVLVQIYQSTPTLSVGILNYRWCVELLDKDPKALRHHIIKNGDKLEDRELALTASTPELQQFILKHLNTDAAWNSLELRRASASKPK